MSNEDEFFAEMHPQIAQVIGIAVMQLLVEKQSISKNTIIEMIQVLWQGGQVELAVELALDVLMLRKSRAVKTRHGGRVKELFQNKSIKSIQNF